MWTIVFGNNGKWLNRWKLISNRSRMIIRNYLTHAFTIIFRLIVRLCHDCRWRTIEFVNEVDSVFLADFIFAKSKLLRDGEISEQGGFTSIVSPLVISHHQRKLLSFEWNVYVRYEISNVREENLSESCVYLSHMIITDDQIWHCTYVWKTRRSSFVSHRSTSMALCCVAHDKHERTKIKMRNLLVHIVQDV